jgi:cytochrome c2
MAERIAAPSQLNEIGMQRHPFYIVFFLLCALASFFGCGHSPQPSENNVLIGDWRLGHDAIQHYGCASCHTIPGIPGADALVGPPLLHMARRVYIGGVLQNTRANITAWIKNPPAIDSKTAMPNLRVSDADAENIVSYLYTLQ